MALYIDGVEVLSNINMYGTWAAVGTVILPAFTLGGTVTLNGQVFDAGSGNAQINTTGQTVGLVLSGSHASDGCKLRFTHDHTTPIFNGIIGTVEFYSYDHAGTPVLRRYGQFKATHSNIGDGTEEVTFTWIGMSAGAVDNVAMTLSGAGVIAPDHSIMFDQSVDSAAVADQVSLSGFDISAGHRALAISSEEVVVAEVDETKFSHKLPVRINGATYNIMLCAT